jgi:hypothetical protein
MTGLPVSDENITCFIFVVYAADGKSGCSGLKGFRPSGTTEPGRSTALAAVRRFPQESAVVNL